MKKWVIIIILSLSVGFLGIMNAKADSINFNKNLSFTQIQWYKNNSFMGAAEMSSVNSTFSTSDYDSFEYYVYFSDYVTNHYNQVITVIIPMSDDAARVLASSNSSYINTYFMGSTISGVHINTTLIYIPNVSENFSALGISFTCPVNSLRGFRMSIPSPTLNTSLTNQKIGLQYNLYEGEYVYESSPELYMTDTHDSTNHNATITVDTSDFSEGNYKYKWGYDQMAMAMQEVVSGTNGYTITVPYNDTIYFAVLEQDDTLVYETTYTIDYDDMPNQYALHFHSWTSWGCNDIVKFVNDNTDYTSPNFWEAGEKLIFFYGYQRRVALGFYADSNLTNRLSLDGSVEFDHDAEIYVKWSTKIPDYQISVYPDDDTIKFRFQITEWLEESRNYQILFNQDIYHVNYTMVYGSRQDGYTTPVDYDENVTIRVVYTENGETVTVWTEEIDISVWVTLYASEDDQEAINLIVEANNVSNNIDAWEVLEDFVELLRVPIDFIIGLISHLYNRLNLHTRVFLIGIFVAEMIAAVAKLMFKR